MGALSHELKTAEEWVGGKKKVMINSNQTTWKIPGTWGPLQSPVLFNVFINE